MQAMESAFDVCTEDLFNQTVKLEEMEKKAGNAEGEVSALRGRLILLQENNEKQEEDLLGEKYKIKKISDDLNQTFEDMINMSV